MTDAGQRERRMTVAHVRESGGVVEVMFLESTRIYRLARSSPAFEGTLAALRAAEVSNRPLQVTFDKPNGDLIERVVSL